MPRNVLIGRRAVLCAMGGFVLSRAFEEELPPVRALTRGPNFHWFAHYDKLQFNPTSQYVLCMEVGLEHRSPRPDDAIRLGMIDLKDGDRWIELGETTAWCWQQGRLLQWLPGSKTEVIWNARENGRYVSHILDVRTRKRRTLPARIYAGSPHGRWAVAPDFRRLADTRPGYGYNGIPDPNKDALAPEDAGIWRMDLCTGEHKQIISFAQIAPSGVRISTSPAQNIGTITCSFRRAATGSSSCIAGPAALPDHATTAISHACLSRTWMAKTYT